MTRDLPDALRLLNVPGDEYEEWLASLLATFGYSIEGDAETVEFLRKVYPADRALAVASKDGYVGTAAAIDLDLALPGGRMVGMSGITVVTVDPTARRQGILRAMMARLHGNAVEEGHPVAGLVPTEWPIYGRFGYGPATWYDSLRIDLKSIAWRDDAPIHGLSLRCVAGKEARDLAYALHSALTPAIPGEVLRPANFWDRLTLDSTSQVDQVLGLTGIAAGPRRCVAVEDRGLVAYRIAPRWTAHSTPNGTLEVTDLLATDEEASAALWRHVLSVDLVTEVQVSHVAVDDRLRWWVTDPRRLRPVRHDGLWLRVLDVTRLLESRQWFGEGALTLTIHDADGYADGTFRVEVDAQHASCVRSTRQADLEMDVASLGAIVLGGTPAKELMHSGHIYSAEPRCAQLWDMLATPERAPFLSYTF